MANYSHIKLRPRPSEADFEPILREAVGRALRGPWEVSKADGDDDGPVWRVTLSWMPKDKAEARQYGVSLSGPFGFCVGLQPGSIAFRGAGLNYFLHWAQGCVTEELADHFKGRVTHDSGDKGYKHGTREYRRGSFYGHLARNFNPPSEEDEQYFEKQFHYQAPPGFWKGEEFG